MEQSRNILKKYWGYDAFRPLQEDIVDAAIYGKDVLALLPTGGGKSICFQVPGMAREGLCLVISPLIALMNDQVDQLQKRGIRAKAIVSGMSYREIDITLDNARFGGLDFLYTSPERLQTKLFIDRFKQMPIGLIVVDEAHCISEWGHDFRPPYREIAKLRECHPSVPFIALTATATPEVKKDIIEQLQLKDVSLFEGSFQRPNISYEVYPVSNKTKAISQLVKRFNNQTGIVYCQKRKSVKEVAQWLTSQGIRVGIYHGGLDGETRNKMMHSWLSGQIHVMVATNAFGMGIDKPNVRFVAHYEFPNNPEAYFQEAGRAGRDGLESRTFVFFEERNLGEMDTLVDRQFPPIELVKNTYHALCNYLNLAYGSGEGESFPIDFRSLTNAYNLDLIQTYSSLKILEMNGDILFSESVFNPTKVKFAVGNTVLYSFQIKHERMSPLITLLARSYPGIFDQFQEINENEFCKRLKISNSDLTKQIQFLEQNGILDVSWKTDKPIVTFLHERLPNEYMRLKDEVYHNRKQLAQLRWQRMRHFLTQPVCRAQFLIDYFGQETETCGKCDYCRSQQNANYTTKELAEIILQELKKPRTKGDLLEQNPRLAESDLVRALQFLLVEEKIAFLDGFYRAL